MLACAHEPLPAVPHTRPRGHAPGPLRARPVRVEPGGGAARVVAARPPAAWLRRAMPPALPSPRRLPVAGDQQPAAPSPPSWRKRDVNEGFRIVAVRPGDVRRLNRRWGELVVPKLGWVRF